MKLVAASLLIVVCLTACGTTTKPTTTAAKTTPKTTTKTTTKPKIKTTMKRTTKPTTKTTTKRTTKPTIKTTTKPKTKTTTKTTTKPTTKTTTKKPTIKTTTRPTTKTTTKPTIKTTTKPTTKTTTKPTTKTTMKTTTKPTTTRAPQNSYCNITTCPVPSDNTLCKYSNTTWGAACLPPNQTTSFVRDSDIALILENLNNIRAVVAKGQITAGNPGSQPPASNMRKWIWDKELAYMAQAHAQQCVMKNDKCRDVSRFQVGQAVYLLPSPEDIDLGQYIWSFAIDTWLEGVRKMPASYVDSFPSNPPYDVAVYSQIVWATTYTVGCGVTYFQSTTDPGPEYPYRGLAVCNFGPAGNIVNSPIYSQGTAGSACPAPTTNNDGLCA